MDSYLKDSQNLIQDTYEKIFNYDQSDLCLYSCDFESLYTNIDLSNALTI